jgi:uncharacterized protein YndB with AHSA1/START domain
MDKPEFVYVTYIATTPERLWAALTEPEFTRQYWGGRSLTSDWQVGSGVKNVSTDGSIDWQGEVLRYEPPRCLSYSFHMLISEKHRAEQPSRVTFELEPIGDLVKLTLTQDQIEPGSGALDTRRNGWSAIISSLKSLLETGHGLPFANLGFAPSNAVRASR